MMSSFPLSLKKQSGVSTVPDRHCGHSSLRLPILGIGCWSFGDGEYWGPTDQSATDAVVRYAVDHGCYYFDTAEAYNKGASEISLGRAIKGISRDQVIIGTKISPSNTEPKTLVQHCEESLRRLQTDYIDLYMVHWPITPHAIHHFTSEAIPTPSVHDAFQTLQQLQREGKIRFIGVSNFGRDKMEEALATGAQIVLNELPYSLLTRAIEWDILPYCREKGIGVLGYMALMQGVLAGIYRTLDDVPLWQRRTRHFDSRRSPECRHGMTGHEKELIRTLEDLSKIAQKYDVSMATMALQWAMAGNGITSSLCGVRSVEKLKQNIAAALNPIDPEIRDALNKATDLLRAVMGPGFDYYENSENDRTK
ncbi:MAG: aldo/keto reductase [Verrucomicrobiota bacterium]